MSEQRDGARWRYRFRGRIHGPFSFHDLRVLAARGRLPRHAQVAAEGSEDWHDVAAMPSFADAFGNAALAAESLAGEPGRVEQPAAARRHSRPPQTGRRTRPATEPPPSAPRPPVFAGLREEERPAAGPPPEFALAHGVYGLYALNFFVPFASLIGVIIAYFKRGAAAGNWVGSHFSWQIRTFWYSLAVFFVTVLLIQFIGGLIGFLGAIWIIYRIAIGWWELYHHRPIGDVDPIENFFWEQGRKLSGSS